MKVMTYLSLTMMIDQLYEAQAKTISRCLSCCRCDIAAAATAAGAVSDADERNSTQTRSRLDALLSMSISFHCVLSLLTTQPARCTLTADVAPPHKKQRALVGSLD